MKEQPIWKKKILNKEKVDIVQINLGNKCNQICNHCHIAASPSGNKNMSIKTAEKLTQKLISLDVKEIEFTGGAPELNPNLTYLIAELSKSSKKLTVRSNLTVLDLPEYSFYIDIFKKYKVKIISSMPDVFEDTVDRQRGKGTFKTCLKIMKILNEIGYATNGLKLDIVYNPASDYLPPDQTQLEREYKDILKGRYDITFNNLITIVNTPIRRFRSLLKKEGRLYDYFELLKEKYNPSTANNMMCRNLLSIDYRGNIYDCDFNLALNEQIKGYEESKFWDIDFDNFQPEITLKDHCYACMADMGSSCHGTLINKDEENDFNIKESVKYFYGEEIKQTSDLKTDACCTLESIPDNIKKILPLINDEIKMKYYGCGSPIPLILEDLNVLDVGCGTGRDTYIMSKLVGENGHVYGIDMTENQINVAKKYIKEQSERFGYKKPNVSFVHDYMENIEKHFKDESIDIVISNCVINLAEDKETIISQIFNILKLGGELYFSDVYADRRSPDEVRKNPLLYGECLGGALYYKDFERIAKKAGFSDPRVMSKREIEITNDEIKNLIGNIKFYSITYRLWKLKGLDDTCEDYGHFAVYSGNIPEMPFSFDLDGSHKFYKNLPEKVCGNTALMLSETRFKDYFKVIGNFDEHFGEFKECSNVNNTNSDMSMGSSGGCGC